MSRIAIVDDNPMMRSLLRAILGRAGYSLVEFEDGRTASRALAADPPDLLICDLNLPGLDGVGLVHELRSGPGPYMPAILLTGSVEVGDQARAIAAGVDEFLAKPIGVDVLLEHVAAVLARSGER